MLAECGCRYVLVGHSERRAYHAESDTLVAGKAQAALARGVTPIVCVGETLAERDAGQTEAVVKRQLSAVIHQLAHCASEIVVAYEPVWAIGTGRTASPEQAQAVHAVLRAQLQAATGRGDSMKILYGGSVKPDNAATLFAQPDIDGGLIGCRRHMHQHIAAATEVAGAGQGHRLGEGDRDRRVDGIAAPAQDFDPDL
jgi:triosephosphate isomerase